MSPTPKSSFGTILSIFTVVALLSVVASATAYAGTSPWPNNKGELCWDANAAGEHSLVIAMVSNDGAAHYLFHGVTYRSDLSTPVMQPFSGVAEIDASNPSRVRILGMLTKTEIRSDTAGRALEVYTGHFVLNYETLNGAILGVVRSCGPLSAPETAICTDIATGPITLTLVDCP